MQPPAIQFLDVFPYRNLTLLVGYKHYFWSIWNMPSWTSPPQFRDILGAIHYTPIFPFSTASMLRPVQSLAANLDHNTPTGGHKHERKCLKAIGFAMYCLSFTIVFFHAWSVSKKCPETSQILLFEGGGPEKIITRRMLLWDCSFIHGFNGPLFLAWQTKKHTKPPHPVQKKITLEGPPL